MASQTCAQCGHSTDPDPNFRAPPWCPQCGADFKQAPAAADASPGALVPALAISVVAAEAPAAAPAEGPAPAAPPVAPATGPRIFGMPLRPSKEAWLLIALVLSFGVQGLYKWYRSLYSLEHFNKTAAVWLKDPAPGRSPAYIRGKVLPVTHIPSSGRVEEDLYWLLPSELRARTPEDVSTVVWLDWEEKPFTVPYIQFTRRIIGIQYLCRVTVIDRTTNEKVAEQMFLGSDPRGSARYAGDRPYEAIAQYLRGLPRKGG